MYWYIFLNFVSCVCQLTWGISLCFITEISWFGYFFANTTALIKPCSSSWAVYLPWIGVCPHLVTWHKSTSTGGRKCSIDTKKFAACWKKNSYFWIGKMLRRSKIYLQCKIEGQQKRPLSQWKLFSINGVYIGTMLVKRNANCEIFVSSLDEECRLWRWSTIDDVVLYSRLARDGILEI